MCEVVKVNVHSPAKVEISSQKIGKGRIKLKLQEQETSLLQRMIILGNVKSQLRGHKNHTDHHRCHLMKNERQVKQKLTQLIKLIKVA